VGKNAGADPSGAERMKKFLQPRHAGPRFYAYELFWPARRWGWFYFQPVAPSAPITSASRSMRPPPFAVKRKLPPTHSPIFCGAQVFHDETLQHLIHIAFTNDYDLRIAVRVILSFFTPMEVAK
jgi:hypothetical protein